MKLSWEDSDVVSILYAMVKESLNGDGIQTLINEMRKWAICYPGDSV